MTEKYPEKAIELLDKYFPKGEKFSRRGEAMVILSSAFIEGQGVVNEDILRFLILLKRETRGHVREEIESKIKRLEIKK